MVRTMPRASLEDDLAAAEAIAARPAATAKELADNLAQMYEAIFNLSLDRYDVRALGREAPRLMRSLFEHRVRLRDQVAGWHASGFMSLPAQRAVRNALRIARYATDMLGELNIGFMQLGAHERTLRGFRGADLTTFVNPAFATGEDLPFQSGDLLLMRGMHHNSAAIARIGDVHSQFSHLCIAHTDEAGKQWVVESLIEEGAVINPLEKALSQGLGRCVLLRHKNAELAGRASALINDLVYRSHEKGGKRIWYDFTMELLGPPTELFCSKLVRLAFELASERKYALPAFTTRYDMKNRDFLDRVGVTAHETFAPADIELEPDFDIVAEWQDYRVTSRLRLQDFLMDALFRWMDEHGYAFKPDLPVHLIGVFGRLSSHFSDKAKDLMESVVPRVPPNMRRSAIQAVAMLQFTAEPLLKELLALERHSVESKGHPLHARDVFESLETKRQELGSKIGYLEVSASKSSGSRALPSSTV